MSHFWDVFQIYVLHFSRMHVYIVFRCHYYVFRLFFWTLYTFFNWLFLECIHFSFFWPCFPLNCAEKSCIHFRYSVVANERIIRDCAWFGWFKFFFYVSRNKKPYMLNSALVFVEIRPLWKAELAICNTYCIISDTSIAKHCHTSFELSPSRSGLQRMLLSNSQKKPSLLHSPQLFVAQFFNQMVSRVNTSFIIRPFL